MSRILLFCFSLLLMFHLIGANKFYPAQKIFDKTQVNAGGNSSYILPKNLNPNAYNLTISNLNLTNNTFKGKVDISVLVKNSTNTIVMNLNSYSINTSSMVVKVSSNRKYVSVKNMTFDELKEMVKFGLNVSLEVGENINMTIEYQAALSKDMSGFYASSYSSSSTNSSGSTLTNHQIAVTQFEATSARKAFPCFDEPEYRANFTINIWRQPNFTSISNMPLKNSHYDPKMDQVLDTYHTSPKMPTYLVAFVVSDFNSITDNNKVRVFARPDVVQEGNYILSIAQNILDVIGNFLNISYPLPKIDVVAVPDFQAGAMENWGLTTYREKYVLYNRTLNSKLDKFMASSVVAHEFGHQWFGDLVTPLWWNYTWLNEAFATYFEYTVPNQVEPDWMRSIGEGTFVMMAVQEALARDTGAHGTPRPMTSQVYTPTEIENIFDYVIYEKGGSILRMTENFLTTDVWRAGLHKYLNDNRYSTGTPDKLLNALQDSANAAGMNMNVVDTLHQWVDQPGYPLVTVIRGKISSLSSNTTFNFTQAPYDLHNSSHQEWPIPLTYCPFVGQGQNLPYLHWLLPSNSSTSLLTINTTGLVIFNWNQVGFFRVNYDMDMWKEIADNLNKNYSIIGDINRGQLIDDAFHLARTAHITYATAFGLLRYMPREQSVVAWNAFFVHMRYLINQFSNTATEDFLKQYSRSVVASPIQGLISNLNNSLSTFSGSLLVQYMSQFACEVALPQCQRKAIDMFQAWRSNKTYLLVPELKQTIICFGLKNNSTLSSLLDVFTFYLNSNNAAEKLTILGGLGCLSNEAVINRYLDMVCDVDANYVRLQDRWIAFRSLAKWQASVMPTLTYIVNNYNKTNNAVGPRLSTVFGFIGKTLSQPSHIEEVKKIVTDIKVDPSLRKTLNQTVLSAISSRLAWASSPSAESLKSYIASQTSAAPSNVFSPLLLISTLILFYVKTY